MKKWLIAVGLLLLFAGLIIALQPAPQTKQVQVSLITYCGHEYSLQEWKEKGLANLYWQKKCPPEKD